MKEKDKLNTIITLILTLMCSITLFLISFIEVKNSLNFSKDNTIKYNERNNINYQVYLKKNDFYEEEYLNKDKVYITNLIDKININYDYNINLNEERNIIFNYDIIAKLEIKSTEENSLFYEKEYKLLENQELTIKDGREANITKDITIDYEKYNQIANKFSSEYNVSTENTLKIYFNVSKKDLDGKVTYEESKSYINIPLSKKAIKINIDTNNTSPKNIVTTNKGIYIKDNNELIIGIIFIISAIISTIFFINTLIDNSPYKSKYDKYIKKLLVCYDRAIININSKPDFSNKNIIKVNEFKELLDIRDTTKNPIIYYSVVSHSKCIFYVDYNNNIYLYEVTK